MLEEYEREKENGSPNVWGSRDDNAISFEKWLEDPPVDAPGNLEVINRYFGYRLNSSEITFQVGEKDEVIDIEDFDMDELALFAVSVGLNV